MVHNETVFPTIDAETVEKPPKSVNGKDKISGESGFNIIHFIYKHLVDREPLGYQVISYYKKLDIHIEYPYKYRLFLFIALLIDIVSIFGIALIILIVLSIITISFARGVGIIDLFSQLMRT
ncbi:hypothetical protein ACFL4D_02160 [Candidatus Margulisiibacteriota bacterium]